MKRIRLLEQAASELLESETNASLVLGVRGSDCEPLVVTALGCSVLVAVGRRSPILMPISSLNAEWQIRSTSARRGMRSHTQDGA